VVLLPNFESLTILKNYLFKGNSFYSQAMLRSFRDMGLNGKESDKLVREGIQWKRIVVLMFGRSIWRERGR